MRKLATIDNWDSNAYNIGSYMQNYCVNQILAEQLFGEQLHIVDLGCGDGKSTANILSYSPTSKITGIDRSPEMIISAQNNYASDSISFEQQDITFLNIHEMFDLVVSFFCLDWIKDQASLQQKIYQALKSNGQILFVISTGKDDIAKIVENISNNPKWTTYLQSHDIPAGLHEIDDYRHFISQAGFIIETFEIRQMPVELPNIESFYRFIAALPLFGNTLTVQQNNDITRDITAAFKNHCENKYEGRLICIGEMIVVKAHKA